jgi:hypothetical protein
MEALHLSRRSLLAGLLATSGAVTVEIASPVPLLAAHEPAATSKDGTRRALLPHFASGILAARSQDRVTLSIPDALPATLTVRLTGQTEICRNSCDALWSALKVGDRVQVGTYDGPEGVRIARWLNANPVVDWGIVAGVSGQTVSLTPMAMQSYIQTKRELLIGPSTTFQPAQGNSSLGQAPGLKVGDAVYFTGTADTPNPAAPAVWARMVFQMRMGPDQDG